VRTIRRIIDEAIAAGCACCPGGGHRN
jgi:hypothetical protein